MRIYDTIIIGGGPAGMTAGIYAVRREMKALIIAKEPGGQVAWASEVENYPGFRRIESFELIEKWRAHAVDLGVEIVSAEVKRIEKQSGSFLLSTDQGDYWAKTVIAAMGLLPRRLSIPGEEEFTGRGVTYCANCDSPFYRGKRVAVIGGGNSAFDAAEILSKIAKQVYLVHRSERFRAFEDLVEEVKSKPNIALCTNAVAAKIAGQAKVEKLFIKRLRTGQTEALDVDGVFIEIGRIAHTDLLAGLADRTKQDQVIVDDKCRTATPGLFAAGDVTTVPFKQITIAMGQATIAALAAYEYLQLRQGREPGVIADRSAKK